MNLWSGNISSSSWLESSAHGSSEKSLVRKGFIAEPLLDYYKVCFLKYSLSTTLFCVCEWLRESVRCSFSFFFLKCVFLNMLACHEAITDIYKLLFLTCSKVFYVRGPFLLDNFFSAGVLGNFVSAPSFFPSTFFSLLP